MHGSFSKALRTERTESESISFRKQWYFLGMLSPEIILEKKPLKILHNSVSLKLFLPFSIRRSSHGRCPNKKDVLEKFAKLTGKQLSQSLFFNKVAPLDDCFWIRLVFSPFKDLLWQEVLLLLLSVTFLYPDYYNMISL